MAWRNGGSRQQRRGERKQKGRREAGLFKTEIQAQRRSTASRTQYFPNSVLGDDRAAPAVVHAHGGEIGALADAVGAGGKTGGERVEGHGVLAEEEMVVLDRHR